MSAGVVYPSEQNQNVINGIENDIDELQDSVHVFFYLDFEKMAEII